MNKGIKATTNEQINIEDIQRAYDSLVNNKKPGIYEILLPYNQVVNIYFCLYKQQEQIKKLKRQNKKLKGKIQELKRDIEILTNDDDNDSVWEEEYNK